MASFINPSTVIAQIGLQSGQTVADLGCGSGFYVIPADFESGWRRVRTVFR
jgi:cyclopropane fatty-acyl-phospholipid synthase-like methyltransferase